MRFSTTLAVALAAVPLSLASAETAQQVRTVAHFWRSPNRQGYIGYINEDNLDRCITVITGEGEIGSAEVVQYPQRGFFCNLYVDTRCTEPWITQVTGYRGDLPGEDIHTRSARCFSYNRNDEEDGDN